MKTLTCARCGQGVFFENVLCSACGATLGFDPDQLNFAAFEIDAEGKWQQLGAEQPALKPCANYAQGICNWTLPADSSEMLCRCCRTTEIIPALSKPENQTYWRLLEEAKRRLFYGLISMKLPVPNKADDREHGVAFHFLEQITPAEKVLTGHDDGVIVLNIAEADDAHRESARARLHEPYRTLVGHFRHEIGHYYWDRLISDSVWLEEYRRLFGDERADYAEALKKHYANPNPGWQQSFISVYASAHPWEDWAECWAHYMHIRDGLETANTWGIKIQRRLPGALEVTPVPIDATSSPIGQALIEQWLPVSQFINAMDRSLGSHDSYPFVLTEPVIVKLEFIHKVISAAASGQVPMRFAAAELAVSQDEEAAPRIAG